MTNSIENWLNTVGFSHSNSENTRISYKRQFQRFLDHIGKTGEQILADYENMEDKQFKRQYTPLIISLIGKMQKEQYSPSTQQIAINVIKSFFKYNSLPLGYIPSGRQYTMFHNRDITKEEIEEIIKTSQPREKAYYALMTQSGLRPNEISNLRIGDIENLLQENAAPPYLIRIQQEMTKGKYQPYFTFTGEESIKYIREYLKRKRKQPPNPEHYLFTMEDDKTKTDTDLISHTFRRTVEKLKKQNVLDFKSKKGERANRNELRLYNLRKYFRNHAGYAGTDYVNFWMGHNLGVDGHYFSQTDTEQHRNQYKEKAMPHLNIETRTPDELAPMFTDLQNKLAKQENENKQLKEQIQKMQDDIERLYQVQYQQTVNLMTKPPEKIEEELRLTPEAYKRIRIEGPKTNKKPSERYRELIEEIESKAGVSFPDFRIVEEKIPEKLMEEIRRNPEKYEIITIETSDTPLEVADKLGTEAGTQELQEKITNIRKAASNKPHIATIIQLLHKQKRTGKQQRTT